MGKKNKAVAVICYAIIALIVAGVLAFILKMTNGGTDDFKFFYVTDITGKVYATKDAVKIRSENEFRFNVKYTFEDNEKGYTVKVVPIKTDATEFEYTVDGEPVKYSLLTDITSAFKIETHDDCFLITIPDKMNTVLEKVHEGKTVAGVPEDLDLLNTAYFSLVITSYNGNDEIVIQIRQAEVSAEGVELDKEGIVLGGA